jgi:hypothetical protein
MKTVIIHLNKKLLLEVKQAALLMDVTISKFIELAIKHKLEELENDGQI